jgi:hypothetical protein
LEKCSGDTRQFITNGTELQAAALLAALIFFLCQNFAMVMV